MNDVREQERKTKMAVNQAFMDLSRIGSSASAACQSLMSGTPETVKEVCDLIEASQSVKEDLQRTAEGVCDLIEELEDLKRELGGDDEPPAYYS